MQYLQWNTLGAQTGEVSPGIAVSDQGVVYEIHGDGSETGVFVQFLSPTGWQCNEYNGAGLTTCSIDANNTGAVFVWDDNNSNLWVSALASPLGTWTFNFLDTGGYTQGMSPDVAVNNNGWILEVHETQSDFSRQLYYCVGTYTPTAATLSEGFEIPGLSGSKPRIAMNDSGDFLLLYQDTSETLYVVPGNWAGPNSAPTFQPPVETSLFQNGDVALDNFGNYLISSCNNEGAISVGTYQNGVFTLPTASTSMGVGSVALSLAATAIALNNSGQAWLEVEVVENNQYVSLQTAGGAFMTGDYSTWMTQNLSVIGDIPLTLLAMPGTHDSGTYAIGTTPSPDGYGLLSDLTASIVQNWAIAQPLSIYQQLQAGSRYLDLRVAPISPGVYCTCHSFFCATMAQVVAGVNQFLSENPTANEIILMDMNHLYDMSASDYQAVANYVHDQVTTGLLPTAYISKSLNELASTPEYGQGARVFLFADSSQNTSTEPWLGNSSQLNTAYSGSGAGNLSVNSLWPNAQDLQGLINSNGGSSVIPVLNEIWGTYVGDRQTPSLAFNVLQCIGTPVGETVFENLGGTLLGWETGICSPYLFYLATPPLTNNVGINVMLVDNIQFTLAPALCLSINQAKAAALAGSTAAGLDGHPKGAGGTPGASHHHRTAQHPLRS